MSFNYFGDLYKTEIVAKLNQSGCNIKNVHELNLIMEEMGLLTHSGNHWMTNKEAVKYTIYNSQVLDADAWHPEIVEVILDYLGR